MRPNSDGSPVNLPADLADRLSDVLSRHRPTRRHRAQFAPELSYGRHLGPHSVDARSASVMLMLFRRDGDWHMPLTVRQSNLPQHAGQVSLPGGMLKGQESSSEGARRETEEEVGVRGDQIRILGQLSPLYVFNSNFYVTPWVGVFDDDPEFALNEAEVAELFEIPLAALTNRGNYSETEIIRGGLHFRAPCIRWGRFTIWGATSMILGEFPRHARRNSPLTTEPVRQGSVSTRTRTESPGIRAEVASGHPNT